MLLHTGSLRLVCGCAFRPGRAHNGTVLCFATDHQVAALSFDLGTPGRRMANACEMGFSREKSIDVLLELMRLRVSELIGGLLRSLERPRGAVGQKPIEKCVIT